MRMLRKTLEIGKDSEFSKALKMTLSRERSLKSPWTVIGGERFLRIFARKRSGKSKAQTSASQGGIGHGEGGAPGAYL